MTDFDKIDRCKYILVTKLFEPLENELAIEVSLGSVSEFEENLFINRVNFGQVNAVNFDYNEKFVIYFASYISYSVLNESYDMGTTGKFSGDKIREYKNSAFIDFCKKETPAFQLDYNKDIKHYQIVSVRHIIDVLTTSQIQVKRRE